MTHAQTPLDYARQTTLITGASAGIGAEFARQLAARGSDLVLVARRGDRLEALADELRTAHGITATAVPLDLAVPGAGQTLLHTLENLDIDVTSVVNNAGFANVGPFHEADLTALQSEIALDVSSVVEISHAFLPGLRARGDGFLINIASMAAYQASPMMAVYGAGKAFVLSFTEALAYETRDTGLRVLALSPGATETEFFTVAGDQADGGAKRMAADAVVATALDSLDRRRPQPSVIAGRGNRLSALATRVLGRRRSAELVGSMMTRSLRGDTSTVTPRPASPAAR